MAQNFRTWKENAFKIQQKFLQSLGDRDWDLYELSERQYLEKFVGYALFGPPEMVPSSVAGLQKATIYARNEAGYSDKQYKTIKKICATIEKEDSHGYWNRKEILMALIFVCLEVSGNVQPEPVFRVPNEHGGMSFIDSNCRVYNDWDDFLENNQLPKCNYCYPCDGVYKSNSKGEVRLEFGTTPASQVGMEMVTAMDYVNIGLSIFSEIALGVPSADPSIVSSVIGEVSTGAHSIIQGLVSLSDRADNNQSIGLDNAEARNCWLSILRGGFGVASAVANGTLTKMEQSGQDIGEARNITTAAINLGSIVVNGLTAVNDAIYIHERVIAGEITPLDILQLTSSVLFFTHSVVDVTIARNLMQQLEMNDENNSNENRMKIVLSRTARNTDCMFINGRMNVVSRLNWINTQFTEFGMNVNQLAQQ